MKRWRLVYLALFVIAFAALEAFQPSRPRLQDSTAAIYSHDVLHAAIPYRAPRAGKGALTVEILNPEDAAVARAETRVEVASGKGTWEVNLQPAKTLAVEDLVWHRLRYRFAYQGQTGPAIQDTQSISQILRAPVIHIIGQKSYFSGGKAAIRVIATDPHDQTGFSLWRGGPSSLRIELAKNGGVLGAVLFRGALDRRGTANAQFTFPAKLAGSYALRYVVDTPIGSAEFTEPVQLQDTASILLTTEKPIYQPGQTIHIRALALDRATHAASAARALTFELEDSRGNKVFRKATQTDAFGVASAEFGLADEVNLGTYHLRAVMQSNTAEIALNVDKYVLPKFKVGIELDSKKHGYRPGDRVRGIVRANYFFGKPVDRAAVTIKASGMDVERFETGKVEGETDADGAYRFDLPLPAYLAGRSNQGAARMLIEATVTDSAHHAETRGEPINVSESGLIVTAVPEGGTLVPNFDNQVFILTSYPDGTPAKTSLVVRAEGEADQNLATDDGGVAVARARKESLSIEAGDDQGNRWSGLVHLESRTGEDQVLLRAQRAIYRPGDHIPLEIFSTKRQGAVYVDVVKDGQTVLTRDVDIQNGRAELTLTATADLTGTVDIHAYIFGKDARTVADHRLVFVQPADELKIDAAAEATTYKPGEDARIRFRVTNSRGEGVQAALGLQLVDEAVFALAEKQPGFAKVFFYLEQELMKPKYEIHSIGMPEIVEPAAQGQAQRRDLAARALFSATELVHSNGFETESARDLTQAKFSEYFPRYQKMFQEQLQDIAKRLSRGYSGKFYDAWGSALQVDRQNASYAVRSAGPDKQFGTRDDLVGYLQDRNGVLTVMGFGAGFGGGRLRVGGNVQFAQNGLFAPQAAGGGGGGVPGGVPGGLAVGGLLPLNGRAMGQLGLRALDALHAAPSFSVDGAPQTEPRVRSYFPEALYINPEIITDRDGRASISIPLADSITTWRMAMLASTARGALGSGTSSLKVFQDFFVDLDLPVKLTQGDRVSLPVAIYNYSGVNGEASLQLQPADWYSLVNDSAAKTVPVESGRVGGSQFTIEARRIGKFKLTLSARIKNQPNADIVVREIEVVPNGREQETVSNGRLETSIQQPVNFPAVAIADASKIFVRLYPGPLSQIVEGMDAVLRMPFGCFEQTSSATYPNVLALDYMKATKKLIPEVRAKAEGFIATGYQRLLTFEVPGGGFSWFGQAPANKILTAYGLMEFSDMSKVHDVDPNVIRRTAQWLVSQQQPDGSWKPDTSFINEGATNRFNSDILRITAYIAWALENTGNRGPAVDRARQFIAGHMTANMDAYTLAVLANFAADSGDREFQRQAIELLLGARKESDDQAWWEAQETGVYPTGPSAAIETTGLAAQALLKSGEAPATAKKALTYIASKKNAAGSWGTTQATIMALRALLLSTSKGAADVLGAVEISLNGKPVKELTLTPENNDLYHEFALPNVLSQGANLVEVKFEGKGSLAYQIAGSYFLPWTEMPEHDPLSIDVSYNRTRLSQDDIATAKATIKSNLSKTANMVMVDLGIPPGFDLLGEDLQLYQEKSAGLKSGRLEKFSLTPTQAILYFDSVAPEEPVTLRYRLRAKYPVRARTFPSEVYEYYAPEVRSTARPVELEVRTRF
jgi:alpha-2-macroglobulin-like protein